MPPKPKVTKDMILAAVLNLTQEEGFEAVNARSIAGKLQCSTRPIFACYESMEQLRAEFLDYAFAFYTRYVAEYGAAHNTNPALLFPLSYIEFAREETNLFRLLFISDMDLDMTEAKDFYKELGNEEKAKEFSRQIGVELSRGKAIFLDLFFYSHGIAVLAATGKLTFRSRDMEEMLQNFLDTQVSRETGKAGE